MTYQDLFDVIGVMHGVGNGIDTFNLPNFTGRFPLGNNGSSLFFGGASTHVLSLAELPEHSHDQGSLETNASGIHNHNYSDPGHDHGGSTGSGPFSNGSFAIGSGSSAGSASGSHTHIILPGMTNITIDSDGNHTHGIVGYTGSTGQSQAVDMMPPYQTIYYIIRA
jgi:microcystin-dependent protein